MQKTFHVTINTTKIMKVICALIFVLSVLIIASYHPFFYNKKLHVWFKRYLTSPLRGSMYRWVMCALTQCVSFATGRYLLVTSKVYCAVPTPGLKTLLRWNGFVIIALLESYLWLAYTLTSTLFDFTITYLFIPLFVSAGLALLVCCVSGVRFLWRQRAHTSTIK